MNTLFVCLKEWLIVFRYSTIIFTAIFTIKWGVILCVYGNCLYYCSCSVNAYYYERYMKTHLVMFKVIVCIRVDHLFLVYFFVFRFLQIFENDHTWTSEFFQNLHRLTWNLNPGVFRHGESISESFRKFGPWEVKNATPPPWFWHFCAGRAVSHIWVQ